MSLDRDIALLSRIPIFGALSSEHLRLLAFSAVRRELATDEVLFRAGEPAQSGFVVVSGEVVLVESDGGAEKVGATCEPGSLIGELALFIDTKRPAMARATRHAEVLEINRLLFSRMLNEYPHVAIRLRTLLSDRLTATVGELTRVRQALQKLELPKGRGKRA
jgi:CRP-like cAMP-binding protein